MSAPVHPAVPCPWIPVLAEVSPWIPIGTLLHLTCFALVCLHTLSRRREPTSTLLWIFIAWALPLFGPLLYVGMGVYRVPEKGWRKQRADDRLRDARRAREDAELPMAYWRAVHEQIATRPESTFARELDGAMEAALGECPLLGGNAIDVLVTGDEAFPAMLKAIAGARHHLHVQTFILYPDDTGRLFMDALAARARAGVRVRVLCDRFGSSLAALSGMLRRYGRLPNMEVAAWSQANPLKRQLQVNLRNHRKILVADGREAFVGGINLQADHVTRGERPPIRDYHFRVRGPIVQELQYTFMRDWYFMTDADPETLLNPDHFPRLEPAGPALVRVVNSGPTSEQEVLADVVFTAVVTARHHILAATPYFVPPPELLRAFRSAAMRGVEVRLIVPRRNNHLYAGLAARALYEDMLAAGVRIFERRPPFMHAKALIVDDAFALVGSANLDVRSLRLNYETNLAVYDEGFIDRLKRVVLEDLARSDEIEPAAWRRRPAARRLLENACNLLTPIL